MKSRKYENNMHKKKTICNAFKKNVYSKRMLLLIIFMELAKVWMFKNDKYI